MPRLPKLPRSSRPWTRLAPPGASREALAVAIGGVAVLAAAAGVNALIQRRTNAKHPPKGRFVEVDGVRVHYLEKGAGSPIVLVHGNGVSAEDFVISGLFDRLAEHHRVIAFDRPGFGHTPRPRRRIWTARAQADLLLGAIEALGLTRPLVVGHSWGAQAALTMALEEPDAIGGLVLMSGYYRPSFRADVPMMSGPALPLLGDVIRYTVSPALGWLSAPLIFKQLFAPARVTGRFRSDFPLSMALRPSQIRASAGDTALMIPGAMGVARAAGALTLPVLILAGRATGSSVRRFQSEGLARKIPGSTLLIVAGAGHMVHHSAPAEVAEAILRFAERAGPAARPRLQAGRG